MRWNNSTAKPFGAGQKVGPRLRELALSAKGYPRRGITQPRAHLFYHPCTVFEPPPIASHYNPFGQLRCKRPSHAVHAAYMYCANANLSSLQLREREKRPFICSCFCQGWPD